MKDEENQSIKKKTGPKPKDDIKEREYLYLNKSIIKKWGGWEKVKAKIYKLLGQD